MIIVIGWLGKGPEVVVGFPDGNPVLDCLLAVGVHGGGPGTADGEIPVGGDLVHLLDKGWSFDKEFGLAASFFFAASLLFFLVLLEGCHHAEDGWFSFFGVG